MSYFVPRSIRKLVETPTSGRHFGQTTEKSSLGPGGVESMGVVSDNPMGFKLFTPTSVTSVKFEFPFIKG